MGWLNRGLKTQETPNILLEFPEFFLAKLEEELEVIAASGR